MVVVCCVEFTAKLQFGTPGWTKESQTAGVVCVPDGSKTFTLVKLMLPLDGKCVHWVTKYASSTPPKYQVKAWP